jgi:hypothetical protein
MYSGCWTLLWFWLSNSLENARCLFVHLSALLVLQSHLSANGTLFQVKVAYAYTPVHDDELTIKPNDIVNVTRMVNSSIDGTMR